MRPASFSFVAAAAGAVVLGGSRAPGAAPAVDAMRRGHSKAPLDTIYQLAVDSAAYREYSFVYLLDEEVAHYEADGRSTRTFRQVVQILKPAAVAGWAERSISYQPEREKVTVNWMRVVRPSGEVISDKPSQSQASDVSASLRDPVYTQTKVLRYSLSNVAPGTIVDLSTTIENSKPPLPGDLLASWSVSMPTPALRSLFVLDVPASVNPRIIERHLDFKRGEQIDGGRHRFTWAARNVRPPRREVFAPDSSIPSMSIRVGSPLAWSDIGRWYNGLSKDRYVLTPALTAAVDSIVRQARSADDTVTALHRWIARDLRYVSISFGIGGYQPRFPEATVATGFGDCKDKATLFIAAARHLGIIAYPVLLNSFGGIDKELPAIEQFNHVIAAVERRGIPGYGFLDLTTFDYPAGEVPPSYQGAFGLVVLPDGSSRDVTFPKDSGGVSEQRFVGELTPDGHVTGRFSLAARGGLAENTLRRAYAEPPDSARRASLKREAPRPFPDATVDTIIFPDGRDRTVPPAIEIALRNGEGAKPAGSLMILSIPANFSGSAQVYRRLVEELERADKRRLPIDAGRVVGPLTTRRELRLTLPAGWTAQLPAPVSASSVFGTYQAEYTQTGRELHIVHVISGRTGTYPPEQITTLIDWLKSLAKDDAEFIPLMRGT
jgi:transglutaminase-like putative cysteine protease